MRSVILAAEDLPRGDLVCRRIAPAGLALEILVDDPGLAELYFSRLCSGASDGPSPDRIYVLGERSQLAVPLWSDRDCSASEFQAIVARAGLSAAYPLIPRFWQFFDSRTRIGIQLSQSGADLPKWDGAAPLRRHLHWLLQARGLRLAHAGTLGWQGRGLLLLGKGGAGKSGTTLAGLAAGLSTLGDDYVALEAGAKPAARSLFRILKQDRRGLGRIPALAARTADHAPNWQDKIEFDPQKAFPGAFADKLALAAVMLPRIVHAPQPEILPVAPSEAMLALMSSNLHQYVGEPENGMAFFGDMLRRLPCYRIDLADDAAANGARLRRFLEKLPR